MNFLSLDIKEGSGDSILPNLTKTQGKVIVQQVNLLSAKSEGCIKVPPGSLNCSQRSFSIDIFISTGRMNEVI